MSWGALDIHGLDSIQRMVLSLCLVGLIDRFWILVKMPRTETVIPVLNHKYLLDWM